MRDDVVFVGGRCVMTSPMTDAATQAFFAKRAEMNSHKNGT